MTFQPIGEIAAGIVDRLAAGHVERHPITSREQWLALRAKDVTASAVGATLGCHEYLSGFALWALKTGRIAEDPEETPPMLRGRLLEPVHVELLREKRPTWTVTQPKLYLRDPAARLGATPDVFAEDPERGFGIVQMKSVEPSVFRRKWRDPETGETIPPMWIVLQGLVEAHLAGARWAAVSAMTVGFGLDLQIVDLPLHADAIDRVRQAVADFWRLVESGRTPDFDYGRDAGLIAEIYGEDNGEEIDLTSDNALPELAARKVELSATKNAAEKELKTVTAEILAKMGHAAVAKIQGGRITARTVHKKAYSCAASSYRTPRVTLTGDAA